uniref:CMP/dCMP-type deaminase domain-containing protein n=1 Tax=Urocitellus parryii TaxID=9999 RepID=A0A8D2IG02_UROPR
MHPQIRRLYRKTFLFHFRNLRWALGRNNTFLCYQVDREERDSTVPIHRGVFKTQVFPETRLHAELCFLYWLHDYLLQLRDQHLQITWFISWSPCSDCAQQVAAFLASHSNLSLTIYAARLYYFWKHSYQEGLRALQREGARVEIMSLRGRKEGPGCQWTGAKQNKNLIKKMLVESGALVHTKDPSSSGG